MRKLGFYMGPVYQHCFSVLIIKAKPIYGREQLGQQWGTRPWPWLVGGHSAGVQGMAHTPFQPSQPLRAIQPFHYPALPWAEELWKMRAGVCPKDRSVPPSVQLTSHFCSIKSTNCCCCQGPELWWSCSSPLRCHSQGEGTARRWRLRTNYYPKGLHLKVKF